ncbi:MAG: nucleotidyltransferase domain-containing protein [Umezawaea sp.]
MDAIRAAREFVLDRFPDAPPAILGGSAATARRTPLSDLDVVVLIGGPPAPFRETTQHDGWVVELFCNSAESFATFVERETAARRSPLLHMCGEGVLLLDRDGAGQRLQQEALARLEAGPPPLSPNEVEDRRYVITDLLDDLGGASDRDESVFIATRLLTEVGELALGLRRCWQGHGKWLFRRLRDVDPRTCEHLVLGYRRLVCEGDETMLRQAVATVLDQAGGRMLVGYRREARRAPSA